MAAKPKPKPPQTPPGAPRWTYVLGALVGAAGLLWGIASFFIPKPAEPPRPAPTPAQQTATAIGGTAINASGDAKVSVGATTPTTAPALATPTANAAPLSAQPPATPPTPPTPPKPDAAAGGQNAQAGPGGIAVNAAGSAQVQVNNKP